MSTNKKTPKVEKTFLEDSPTDPALPTPRVDQVTKNFKISEMEINGQKIPGENAEILVACTQLLKDLQVLRDYLGLPISILSGYRTEETQRKLFEKDPVGVAKHSQHCFGRAADISVKGMTSQKLADAIFLLEAKGAFSCKPSVGIYPTFVHFDIRTKYGSPRARWGG